MNPSFRTLSGRSAAAQTAKAAAPEGRSHSRRRGEDEADPGSTLEKLIKYKHPPPPK